MLGGLGGELRIRVRVGVKVRVTVRVRVRVRVSEMGGELLHQRRLPVMGALLQPLLEGMTINRTGPHRVTHLLTYLHLAYSHLSQAQFQWSNNNDDFQANS